MWSSISCKEHWSQKYKLTETSNLTTCCCELPVPLLWVTALPKLPPWLHPEDPPEMDTLEQAEIQGVLLCGCVVGCYNRRTWSGSVSSTCSVSENSLS